MGFRLPVERLVARREEDVAPILYRLDRDPTPIAYDTETMGWDPGTSPVNKALVVCFSLAGEGWEAVVDGRFIYLFRPWMENPRRPKITANDKFEKHVAANHHINFCGTVIDTVLADYTLDPSREWRHGVKPCVLDWLGIHMKEFDEIFPDGDVWRAWNMEPERTENYSALDSRLERQLGMKMMARMKSIELSTGISIWDYYQIYQRPYADVLFQMERKVILVDEERLQETRAKILHAMDALEYRLVKLYGSPVDIKRLICSPAKLAQYLYDKLGLECPFRTNKYSCRVCYRNLGDKAFCPKHPRIEPERTRSTKKFALELLAGEHPFPAGVVQYRSYTKSLETVDKMIAGIDPVSGRIHTNFNQHVARTGRLSSSNPNVQNIQKPDKDKEFQIRRTVIPAPGYILEDFDESQLEYRILGHLSGEPRLLDGFARNLDFHSITAHGAFNLPCEIEEVAELFPTERGNAKIINFGITYGAREKTLARSMHCTVEKALEYMARHKRSLPGVHIWWDETIREAYKNGWVQTILGWRRPIPELGNAEEYIRHSGERIAINTPVQGSAAELIKAAQLKIAGAEGFESPEAERLRELGAEMTIQVHDEVVLETPVGTEEEVGKLLKPMLEHPLDFDLRVPLIAEGGPGMTWTDAKG